MATTSPEQRLRDQDVAKLLGIGRSTVWQFASDGRLPRPERWGKRCSTWRYGDILDAAEKMREVS